MKRLITRLRPNHKPSVAEPTPSAPAIPVGLQILAQGNNPLIDIVAVHGLNGHAEKTWTASNGVNWLRDFLPEDLPHARILSWGYDAKIHGGPRISCQHLYNHSLSLISDLCLERTLSKTSERPIIFLAHSLGGIIVKGALIHSDAARRGSLEAHRAIKLSTYGVIFMGTPHQGGNNVALGETMVKIASIFIPANDGLLKHLRRDSEWLQQQLGQYGPISEEFVTKYAYEEYTTPTVLGNSILVVPRASAVVPGAINAESLVIHADHINMVKFASKLDDGYRKILGHVTIMSENAREPIKSRWKIEDKVNRVKAVNDEDTFKITSSIPEISAITRSPLLGRQDELRQMNELLRGVDSRKVLVLHGLGGIGKTRLAIEYACQFGRDYSAVFWFNSKDIDTIKQAYLAAAKRIFLERPSLTHFEPIVQNHDIDAAVEVVQTWLNNPANGQSLLIYDSYDTPGLPTHKNRGVFSISPFLPDHHQGSIVITTRSSGVRVGYQITLKKLQDIGDSLQILSLTSGRNALQEDQYACELVEILDGLPLALVTAGAYLKQVSTSVCTYLRLYKESWLRLQQKTPKLLSYEDRALYSTWNTSLEHIKKQFPLAENLLRLWAYFDNQDVWLDLLQDHDEDSPEWFATLVRDQLDFDEVVRALCDHALIEADTALTTETGEATGYSMHNCVHSWTSHVLNHELDVELARLAVTCVGRHIPSRRNPNFHSPQLRLLRHANRALGVLDDLEAKSISDSGLFFSMSSIGMLYNVQNKKDEAIQLFTLLLRAKERNPDFGPDHFLTLDTVRCLASIHKQEDDLNTAEKLYLRALRGYEKVQDSASIFRTQDNLGCLNLSQGHLDDAEKMFMRALQGKEKMLGTSHPSTLNTVHHLGLLYLELGRISESQDRLQSALEGHTNILGPNHLSTLEATNSLGYLYAKSGNLKDAETLLQQALGGFERVFGNATDHLLSIQALCNLAFLYRKQGKLKKAMNLYQEALKALQNVLGLSHSRCQVVKLEIEELQLLLGDAQMPGISQ